MPTVTFTPNLERHIGLSSLETGGTTVSAALAEVFTAHPRARSYVLDDQGALRKHMIVFVDGAAIKDRTRLSDPAEAQSAIYVMQALSGG